MAYPCTSLNKHIDTTPFFLVDYDSCLCSNFSGDAMEVSRKPPHECCVQVDLITYLFVLRVSPNGDREEAPWCPNTPSQQQHPSKDAVAEAPVGNNAGSFSLVTYLLPNGSKVQMVCVCVFFHDGCRLKYTTNNSAYTSSIFVENLMMPCTYPRA